MEKRIINRNWDDIWNMVRSLCNPLESFNIVKSDAGVIEFSHMVPGPFGLEEREEKGCIIHPNCALAFSMFLETIMREILFEDYVNGDAVPGLQQESYDSVLSILLHGARNGDIDGFHGGLASLEQIEEWSKTAPSTKEEAKIKFDELNQILDVADLNLKVTYKI